MKPLPQSDPEFIRALGGDYFGYLLTNGAAMMGSLLLLPILTRALPAAELGLYSLIDAAFLLGATFSLLGLKFAYLYFYARTDPGQRRHLLGTTFAISTSAAGLSGLLLTGIFSHAGMMARLNSATLPEAWLLIPLMITAGWQTLLHTEQRAERQIIAAGLISITQVGIWLAASAYLVLLRDAGLGGLLTGQIIGQLAACLLALLALRKGRSWSQRFGWDAALVAPLVRYGMPMMLGLLLRYSLDSLSRFMLAAIVGIEAAADFLVAQRMAAIFDGLLALPFFAAWGGLVHHALKQPNAGGLLSRISLLVALACAGLILLLLVLQPWLFQLFASGPRPDLAGLFAMILLSKAVFVLRSPLAGGIFLTERTGWAVTNALVSLAAFLLCAWPAMAWGGAYGAALAVGIAYLFGSFLLVRQAQKQVPQTLSPEAFVLILGIPALVVAYSGNPGALGFLPPTGFVLLLLIGWRARRSIAVTNPL